MRKRNFKILAILTAAVLLISFSACTVLDSDNSSSEEQQFLKVEGDLFESEETVTVRLNNYFDHEIYAHNQGLWRLEQKIGDQWKTVYAPITDTGPPGYSLFVEPGEVKSLHFPAIPDGAVNESRYDTFRYVFGLLYEPDINTPLPENLRTTESFIINVKP